MIIFTFLFILSGFNDSYANSRNDKSNEINSCAQSVIDLKMNMRKLWEDHITWTRGYLISSIAGLENVEEVAQRLLKNQEDIGNAMKIYYGNEAGEKVEALLKDHILTATKLVSSAKSGNKEDLEKYTKEWYENANDIAAFLNQINPNWPKNDLLALLNKHLALTIDEAVAIIEKDWIADIEAYDKGHDHILMMADALSAGIIKQFSEKFAK